MAKVELTDEEWKKKLTPEQYKFLREGATEAPFSGKLYNSHEQGMYLCAACGQQLFSSDTKFESNTPGLLGWPSFTNPVNLEHIELHKDKSFGMDRTEVICKNCGSHLGHVFEEIPGEKSDKHYCINSACLTLKKEE